MRSIGPELISAASDNDPTNVGTAAAVGAQTGYQLSWLALLVAPLLAVVLTIAGQVGTAARDDLQSLTLKRYGQGVAAVLLVSVVVVNVFTIAADLQAGAADVGLLAGVDSRWLVAPLGAAVAGLLLAGRYGQVVAVLRYLMLGFAAFGAAAVLAHPDWPRLLAAGPRCPGHGIAADLPAASHRRLGRHRHRRLPRPARHPQRSGRQVLTGGAHSRPAPGRAQPPAVQTAASECPDSGTQAQVGGLAPKAGAASLPRIHELGPVGCGLGGASGGFRRLWYHRTSVPDGKSETLPTSS